MKKGKAAPAAPASGAAAAGGGGGAGGTTQRTISSFFKFSAVPGDAKPATALAAGAHSTAPSLLDVEQQQPARRQSGAVTVPEGNLAEGDDMPPAKRAKRAAAAAEPPTGDVEVIELLSSQEEEQGEGVRTSAGKRPQQPQTRQQADGAGASGPRQWPFGPQKKRRADDAAGGGGDGSKSAGRLSAQSLKQRLQKPQQHGAEPAAGASPAPSPAPATAAAAPVPRGQLGPPPPLPHLTPEQRVAAQRKLAQDYRRSAAIEPPAGRQGAGGSAAVVAAAATKLTPLEQQVCVCRAGVCAVRCGGRGRPRQQVQLTLAKGSTRCRHLAGPKAAA